MYFNHININQLTNLEANYYLCVNARACAQRMKISKEKLDDINNKIENDWYLDSHILNMIKSNLFDSL